MQDNDTSRRRKFYDQMSETYDLGSFDEFNTKMDSPESREKLFKYIDGDGKFDIGDFDYFDKAMAPAEKQAPEQTAPVQQVSQSGKTEYPQPYDALGNPITNNGEPYSQEVLSRYYSQDNQGENRKDLSQIVMEMQQQKPVSEMHTTQGTAYIPPAPTIAQQEEAFAEQMRRLHDNADWRNKEMTLQPAAGQQPVRSTQGEIFDQLYNTFDEAYRNGQMGGRSAYSLTREAAERMGIDDDEKMTSTNKLLGAVNRRYAKDKAAEAVKSIMEKMPESSDNPIDALQAAYYDRDLQQQLMTTAAKMGNDYQDYVNMFLKPQIVEAMKQKYGGTDADWSSVRGLFSNWEHVKDRLEHQDVSGLLSEHFAPAIDQAINDAYEQALGVESEHEQTHQAGPQFSTGNMSGLVNDILAKKKGNEIRDPEAIRERFEQVLFGRKAGTDSQEQADSSQEDERMLSMAVKEIMTDDNLSKEVFERSGKAGMNTVDYIRKYVLPEMLQSVRNQFEKAFIEKEMPKSTAEYILKGLTEDNIIMMLANRYMRTGEQQRYANMADVMTQQGKNEAVDPGILAQGARLATGMASDFWLWSGWGKIGQAAAGELLAQRVAQRAAADHITRAAAARLIEEEGKQFLKKGVVENMMRHIPQSAVTLGGAEGTSEAVRGIRDREDAATIIGNTIGAAAQGATTGTMFGITGGLTGRLTSQLSGAKRLAGKIAGFGTEAATMYTAEELQKMAQGEDAFRNPFDGLIESGIKLGFIKLSANPLATGERLIKAIANPVKAIKKATSPDKPLLTEDDVKDITESKDGKTLMDALTSMRPARSTDGQEREGYIGEADAEIAAEAYRNYMTDPNRPWERKQKVAHLLGGMIEPPGHEVKADITDAGDGTYVRTYDLDKNVIRETRYDSREDAEKAVADMDQDIDDNITAALDERINKIDAYERFGEFFEQGYQKAAEKTGAGTEAGVGEALTDQDRQFIYLHQHKDELLDVYKKIASGESLGVDEQQLADEYMKTFRAFVEKGIASQDFMREFEQATGLPEGTLRKAIEGTETENGRQRTDLQQQIVDAYRLTAMKYIAEKEGRQQETQQFAEDRLTGDAPAEEQKNGNIRENIPAEQISDQIQEHPAQESVETETPMPEGTTERREAAYDKGLSVASDPSVLTSIGHDERLITARMNQMQSDERLSRLVKACISASETGDTTEAERLLADQQDTMTPEQFETVSQYLDILETRNGIEDAVIRQTQEYGDQQREQLKVISAPDGTVTPLQLKDGTIVYYKSGDLSNHYGGVIVTDEAGQNRQVPVFSITDVMPTETVDDIVERRVNDYAATLQQQYAALSTGIPSQGQQVSMILLGQRVTATMAGTDAKGNLVFQFEDGSMMPMSTEDAGQAIMAADDQDIQAQLQQEADKTRQAEQQQRFATGIQGYTEGKPDITAPGTDPTVAAEYLKTQIPDDKARRQQLTSIQSNKEQLAAEKIAAEKEIERLNEWLQGNEDMATDEDVSQAKERITELERTIAEGEARNRNYGEIRRRLMTADELADMERERRKEISKATGSYTPQPPVRKLTTNEDRITMEDGKPNFGLTSVANANNYLLKTYPDSIDAERFITGERLALRNRQRDEVQPQINAASDILNSYITGVRDLTNQEVQDLAHRLADLEAYQSALSQEAVNLRQIAEGIPALYERNRETAPMTAEEQRLSRLDKAVGREDKIRIAEDIYQGYPEALDIIKNREPRDVYEYIADNLGTNSINWEGIERGGRHVRGLQEELGRGWERGIGKGYSTNAFNMYLAAKGEGKGIEEIVHDLYEGQPDVQGEHPYSDVDIRNALLDMFSTAQKPSDISHRIIDNRIAEAEESVKAEEERYRELEREAQNVNDVKENGNQEENTVSLQQANESLQAVIDETAEEISVAPSRIVNNEADLDTLKAAKVGDEFLDKIRQDLADEATVGRYIPELGMIVFYAEKMARLGMTPEEKKASIYHENVHALSRLGYTREDYAKTAALINAEYIMDEVLSAHADQSEDVRNEEVTGYFVQAIVNGGPAEDFLSGTYSESSPELNVRINEISNILRNGQQELQVRTGLELEGAPEAEARPGEAARADSAAADQGINVGKDSIQGLDGYTEQDITDLVSQHFNNLLGDDHLEIVGMKVIGSRTNGTAKNDSDIDVLLEYQGDMSEDALFNILNDEENRLTIEGLPVDINPITKGKSGTINQWLERNKDYQKEDDSFPARLAEAKAVKFTPMRKAAGGKDKKIREERQIVTKIAADETADNLGGVKVKYVSGSDITDTGLKMENEKGTLGLYDPNDGSVTLFLDNIADADEARRTVCHEKLGHEGLVAIFGSQDEVNRFGQFVFDSASKDIRRRIIERADEEGYSWSDYQRFSKAAQEVLADIAADGPRTADEFSLWRKVKHYLIEWLNKLGLRVRGLLNDHDLAYYILKTGEALKRWNSMPKDQQTIAAAQQPQYTVMRSRRGRPRKRNDESMAQYLERLREWEMWKEAEQRAAEANDPMPDADAINKKYEQQFNADLAEWRKNHNIPEGQTSAGEFPKRRPDETPQDYAVRVADYESLADTWKDAPRLFDYLQKANEEHKEAYRAWKERYGIREKENVDLNMYENTTSDTTPEIESRLERDLAEAVGVDMSSEGARKHAKMSLIERRKNLEGANAEDAVWIHDMVRRIDRIAKTNGVSGKEVREVMMFMIEADRYRYFKDQEKQEAIAMVNTSDVFMKNHSFITEENLLAIKPEMVAAGDAYTAWQAVPSDPKREKSFHDAAIRLAEKLNSLNKDADGYHDIFGDEIMRIFPTLLHASVAGGGSAMPTSAESYMQFDGMKELLTDIKDWYDYFYHQIEDAGLRNDAGYIADGYINHIWDREKSDPKAWEKYVENYQRTKSPNMKEREIPTYMQGIEVGLVPKYRDVADIMAYYSASNNEAVANKKFLDSLSFIVVEELNNTGEVVSILPLLDSKRPDLLVSDRYKEYHVPGVGDVWVLKDVQRMFANVFGTMRTQDVPDWLSKIGKGYDLLSSVAKKIQLSFSAFHMGALTEVALAQMRPDRALKALAQYIIFDCAKKGTLPAYAHPDDFKMAARHLVQLGATQDYSAADVNNVTEKLRNFVRELADSEGVVKKGAGYAATPIAAALDFINKGMDTVLWNYLHDGLKIACFKMFAEQIEDRVEKEGLTADQREQLLDEAGQYVNDTFGGQYWELINVSPALLKWLRRAFLSPDWLISTQRHFLANLGFGSLYSESGFLNYLEYNKDNIKRAFGADIPRNENRRFRSKNAKQCYILGVCGFFYIMMNALNAMMRSWDEQKEKAKADEIRQDNPGYLSPYELAYPDGMKWYDYTMYGNTIGQSTHLFMGRYNDGTEWYARWGKQFREFPELFIGRHGLEFPTPLMERMSGKANPIGRYLLYDLPLTVGMYGYQQPRDTKEIASKYGNMAAVTAMTAKKFLPFSVPTQKDKEFKLMDLVMPSQKGFTRWKTVDYFTTYIQAGDMDGVSRTYNAAVMNGIDAEDCLKAAISTIRATQRRELKDGITDLQTAMERFDAAKTVQDRKALRTTIFKYLAEQNYKAITKSEALEQVDAFLNGEQPTEQEINGYIGHAAATDIRDDYRVQLIEKQAKKFTDEVRTAEGSRQQRLRDNYQAWFEAENLIKRYKKSLKKSSPGYDWWKRQLGKDPVTKPDGTVIDDNYRLEQIRTMRREMIEKIDALR